MFDESCFDEIETAGAGTTWEESCVWDVDFMDMSKFSEKSAGASMRVSIGRISSRSAYGKGERLWCFFKEEREGSRLGATSSESFLLIATSSDR